MHSRFPLGMGACLLALASLAHAQTAPTAPSYKYSVTLTLTVPKGSAAEAAAKDKTKPAAMRYSPCLAGTSTAPNLDQLAFNLKYDAGKDSTSMRNVYLLFYKDGTFFPLVRQRLTTTGSFFKSYPSVSNILATDTYTAAGDNLGGAQTEVILGGNLVLEGLPSGVWTVTAIVAAPNSINFDNPATWDAWDTVPFMLGKPWLGVSHLTCQ